MNNMYPNYLERLILIIDILNDSFKYVWKNCYQDKPIKIQKLKRISSLMVWFLQGNRICGAVALISGTLIKIQYVLWRFKLLMVLVADLSHVQYVKALSPMKMEWLEQTIAFVIMWQRKWHVMFPLGKVQDLLNGNYFFPLYCRVISFVCSLKGSSLNNEYSTRQCMHLSARWVLQDTDTSSLSQGLCRLAQASTSLAQLWTYFIARFMNCGDRLNLFNFPYLSAKVDLK